MFDTENGEVLKYLKNSYKECRTQISHSISSGDAHRLPHGVLGLEPR